ncbi:hypothetical protein HDU91_003419 [Kappamyces sp. JEL0680]|nr:hypothetical protein HDU91_003419 [Kappamyces sp. JEL0680]
MKKLEALEATLHTLQATGVPQQGGGVELVAAGDFPSAGLEPSIFPTNLQPLESLESILGFPQAVSVLNSDFTQQVLLNSRATSLFSVAAPTPDPVPFPAPAPELTPPLPEMSPPPTHTHESSLYTYTDLRSGLSYSSLDSTYSNSSLPSVTARQSSQAAETELEDHLLSLAFLGLSGLSCELNLGPIEPTKRSFPLSQELKRAFCFRGCFFSTHPLLFGDDKAPSLEKRIRVASERYPWDEVFALGGSGFDFSDPIRVCDTIRALFVHAVTFYSMAMPDQTIPVLHKAIELIRRAGFLQGSTFRRNGMKQTISIDDVASIQINPISPKIAFPLSEYERGERLCILVLACSCDVFLSLATASSFLLDMDTEIPEIHVEPQTVPWSPLNYKPEATPGHRTIWENNSFSSAFELGKCFSFSNIPLDVFSFSHSELANVRVYQKIIKFSRRQKYSDDNYEAQNFLHTSLLDIVASSLRADYFSAGLTPYLWGHLEPPLSLRPMNEQLVSGPVHHAIQILMSFALLHLGTFSNQDFRFSSEKGSQPLHTSAELLYAVTRALALVLKRFSAPIMAAVTPFSLPSSYESLSQAPPPGIPSPLIADPSHGLGIYIILSTVIAAFASSNRHPDQAKQVFAIIRDEILPILDLSGAIWPASKLLSAKIREKLPFFM